MGSSVNGGQLLLEEDEVSELAKLVSDVFWVLRVRERCLDLGPLSLHVLFLLVIELGQRADLIDMLVIRVLLPLMRVSMEPVGPDSAVATVWKFEDHD